MGNKKLIMHSVPLSLFLVLFVQTTTGELSLPSLPEAVQLLQLETIRGLEQTILEKEDENRRLQEMIQSVEMEKDAATHNNTMLEEEMERILSERENVIGELESRLQFKNKELDEISERLDQSEKTVTYMGEVMLHSNQVMEEQENLLKVQADAIHELNEEVNMGRNCSTSPTECSATSGPEAGSPCVFPFTFMGVSNTSWGYCGATCPVEESSTHSSHLLFQGSTRP